MQKNKKILMVLVLVAILIGLAVWGVSIKKDEGVLQQEEVSPYLNSNIEVRTFEGENGWGYDVFIDGAQYVHQPNIPALPGKAGFKTEADAKEVGELVIQKIRNNIMPPSVTPEEVNAIIAE